MHERLVVAVPVPDDGSTGAAGELVADRLFSLGASGVAEVVLDCVVHLVGDVRATDLAAVGDGLGDGLGAVRVLEPDRAWTDGWRAHARVWRAGRFVVRPPWLAPGPPGPAEVELVVDPGDAFGSGSHATTRGCLVVLDGVVAPGARVLDVGCGSGVLSVAAARLGAGRVVAVDVDPAAVAATAAVAAANGVADRIDVVAGSVEAATGGFDVVLANLLVPVVEELGGALVDRVAPGGHLVVGGLLTGHRDRALAAVAGAAPVGERTDDGWLTLVLAVPPVGARPGG